MLLFNCASAIASAFVYKKLRFVEDLTMGDIKKNLDNQSNALLTSGISLVLHLIVCFNRHFEAKSCIKVNL